MSYSAMVSSFHWIAFHLIIAILVTTVGSTSSPGSSNGSDDSTSTVYIKRGIDVLATSSIMFGVMSAANITCTYHPIAISTDRTACTMMQPSKSYIDAYILVHRGGCSLHSKALNVENSGAAGVIFVNTDKKLFPAPLDPSLKGKDMLMLEKACTRRSNGSTGRCDVIEIDRLSRCSIAAFMIDDATAAYIVSEMSNKHTNHQSLQALINSSARCASSTAAIAAATASSTTTGATNSSSSSTSSSSSSTSSSSSKTNMYSWKKPSISVQDELLELCQLLQVHVSIVSRIRKRLLLRLDELTGGKGCGFGYHTEL